MANSGAGRQPSGVSTHLSVLDTAAFSPTSQELDFNSTQLRLVREQTANCIKDLNALRTEVLLLKSEQKSDRLNASALANSMEGKQVEVQEHFERDKRERTAVLQQLARKVHDLQFELPSIRDEMSLMREQLRSMETAWHPHIQDLHSTFLKDVEARHQAHGQLEQKIAEIDAGMTKHSALHKDVQDRLQSSAHQDHVEKLGRELQTHMARVSEMQEHHANLRQHLETEKETKNKALQDLNALISKQLGRNLSDHSAPVKDRLEFLEKLMGDSAARHVEDLAATHQKIQDHSIQTKVHAEEQKASQISLAARVEFLEKSLGDSAAKHGQELRDAHQRIADLSGSQKHALEQHHATLTQRIDYLEKVTGDSSDKHTRELEALKLAHQQVVADHKGQEQSHGQVADRLSQLQREKEDLHAHHKSLAERMTYLEKLIGDNAEKHAKELQTVKDKHAKLDSGANKLQSHHAGLEERMEYLESKIGDSADQHDKELSQIHAKMEELHGKHEEKLLHQISAQRTGEERHASMEERLKFLESTVGDNAEKLLHLNGHLQEHLSVQRTGEERHASMEERLKFLESTVGDNADDHGAKAQAQALNEHGALVERLDSVEKKLEVSDEKYSQEKMARQQIEESLKQKSQEQQKHNQTQSELVDSLQRTVGIFDALIRKDTEERKVEMKRLWDAIDGHTHDLSSKVKAVTSDGEDAEEKEERSLRPSAFSRSSPSLHGVSSSFTRPVGATRSARVVTYRSTVLPATQARVVSYPTTVVQAAPPPFTFVQSSGAADAAPAEGRSLSPSHRKDHGEVVCGKARYYPERGQKAEIPLP